MRKKTSIALVALTIVLALASCSTKPPYTVKMVEHESVLPRLHSFTHATYGDKIVLFGGRIRGLHSSNYTFGSSAYNNRIYVVDTHNWSEPSKWSVISRPDSVTVDTTIGTGKSPFLHAGQFRANNAEFFTKDGTLYVIGGLLGTPPHAANPSTLRLFTAIDLKELIDAVTNGTTMPANSIQQCSDTIFGITGGEVGFIGNTVHLAFGWAYDNGGPGTYTHRVSAFTFKHDRLKELSYSVQKLCKTCIDDSANTANGGNFRRRDGSMSAMIDPSNGSEGLLYYSGVFKNGNTNFDTPVRITKDEAKEVADFHMRSNVYTCMVVPVYSEKHKEFYATMLGGMTNGRNAGGAITNGEPRLMDEKTAPFLPVDIDSALSVPFINDITTIVVGKDHKMKQYLLPDSFPQPRVSMTFPTPGIKGIEPVTYPAGSYTAHNGAESEIIWTLDKKYLLANGVIDYDKFIHDNKQGGVVGYLYGGILSIVNNTNMFGTNGAQETKTMASNRIFAITIVPLKEEK